MIYIALTTIFYTIALLAIAQASRRLDSTFATAIINTLSAIIPIVLSVKLVEKYPISQYRDGWFYAIGAGIAIALFTLFLAKSFVFNKVGLVTPIVYGGSLVGTTLLASWLFGEKIQPLQGWGIAVIVLGIVLVVMSVQKA